MEVREDGRDDPRVWNILSPRVMQQRQGVRGLPPPGGKSCCGQTAINRAPAAESLCEGRQSRGRRPRRMEETATQPPASSPLVRQRHQHQAQALPRKKMIDSDDGRHY